jgi:hypothetical protein
VWVHVGKKIVALYWFGKGSQQKTREKAAGCVSKTVEWSSSTDYLSKHAFFLQHTDPGKCFDTVTQMIYNYDGKIVLWEAYDQMSRISFKLGAVNLADYFNHKALALNPTFEKGLQFRESIDNLFNKMKEQKNGTVEVC